MFCFKILKKHCPNNIIIQQCLYKILEYGVEEDYLKDLEVKQFFFINEKFILIGS